MAGAVRLPTRMGKASRRLSLRSPALQGALFILYMMVHRPFVRVWLQYKVRPFREQREQGRQGTQRERPSREQWPDPERGTKAVHKGDKAGLVSLCRSCASGPSGPVLDEKGGNAALPERKRKLVVRSPPRALGLGVWVTWREKP